MKTITPGHKYELENFEPNPPINSIVDGLVNDAYGLCLAIEKLPPSEEQTKLSTMASTVLSKSQTIINGNQTIQFIQKTPRLDARPDDSELMTVGNGTTNEEVLKMLIDRMEFLYNKFPSEETACSIGHLKSALYAQQSRTFERQQRGVEGKHLK